MEKFDNMELLEPSQFYKMRLKDAFHDNAVKFFEDMDKEAGIDVSANQTACATFYKEDKVVQELAKKQKRAKVLKILSIIFGIILILAGGVFILIRNEAFDGNTTIPIVIAVLLMCAGVGLFVNAIIKSKKGKTIASQMNEHQLKADNAKAEAYATMAPLNNMYEWNMAANLMTQTTPLIQLDQVFDGRKFEMLHDKFGYGEDNSTNTSMLYVQSGSILGNPFVFEKNMCQTMRNHRYTGTRVVSYTVTERDSDGKLVTRTVNETLTAYVDKPEPAYYKDTTLIYANDAAPKLCFSRRPTGINSMNEKQVEKYVKEFDKKLDKLTSKSIDKGGSFTRLANEEFEALFNALDRNNETEFRLLFTPLAQQNMVKLLKEKEIGYGDDFSFKKENKLNFVNCNHMQQTTCLDRSPESLMCFDYKLAKDTFVNYCDEYLKNVFFNFAPLLSIPLYQQNKTIDYIYRDTFKHNITKAEAESAANAHDPDLFAHKDTRSEGVILKSDFVKTDGKSDICNITAYSFRGDDRVEMVPVMARNGKYYDVAVNWIEYSQISKVTPMVVGDTETDLKGYRALKESGKFDDIINKFSGSSDMLYKKRLFSFVMKDNK